MGDHEPYEVAGAKRMRPLRLRGEVVVRPDTDALIDALLADLFIHAGNCVRTFGDFQFAVDGDDVVEPVLRRLLYEPSYREFPWLRTRVWLVRERLVAGADSPRRWDLVREMIVEQSGVPPEQVHAIESWQTDAAERYAAALREHLGWRTKGHDRLDVVLLGMDDDGGVGGMRASNEAPADMLCVRREGEVGMSSALLNASRLVAVYAPGDGANKALREIEANLAMPREARAALPGLALAPHGGELRWYLEQGVA